MKDLVSAKEAMAVLIQDPVKCALLHAPFILTKSLLSTQIAGVYNLIYSHIEADFPRRDEAYFFANELVEGNFIAHCAQSHDGQYYVPASFTMFPAELLNMNRYIPKTSGEDIYNTKVPGPTGALLDMPPDPSELIVKTIGYGV
jgi:hypothetical protein